MKNVVKEIAVIAAGTSVGLLVIGVMSGVGKSVLKRVKKSEN